MLFIGFWSEGHTESEQTPEDVKFKLIRDDKARTLFNPKYKEYKKEYKKTTKSKRYWSTFAFNYKKAKEYIIKNNITI